MSFTKLFLSIFTTVAFSAVSIPAQNFVPNARVADRTIEQQVFKKLKGLPRYGVFDFISYQVNGGTVTLTGKTISLGTKNQAGSAIKRIPGVTEVVNNIDELPPSGFDASIRRQTLASFADKGLYRYLWEIDPEVRIIVDRGHVTLEGYVANRSDKNLMNVLAYGVPGVFSVTNNLIVGKDERR